MKKPEIDKKNNKRFYTNCSKGTKKKENNNSKKKNFDLKNPNNRKKGLKKEKSK